MSIILYQTQTPVVKLNYFSQFETTVPQYLFDAWSPYATDLPSGRTFEEIMTLWTEQPGFPVVNIEMQGDDAVLTQVSVN